MKIASVMVLSLLSFGSIAADLKPESECKIVASMYRMYTNTIPLEITSVNIAEAAYDKSVHTLEVYAEAHGDSDVEVFNRLYNEAEIDWQRYSDRADTLKESKSKADKLYSMLEAHCYAYYDFN